MIFFRILLATMALATLSGQAAAEETPKTPATHHVATTVRKVKATPRKVAAHKVATRKAKTITHHAVVMAARPVVVDTVPMPALGPHAPDPQDAYNTRSMADLQLAAQGGDLRAEYTLGMNYRAGTGTRSDLASAFKWQSQAAQSGFGPAQADLGCMHMKGIGVSQDYSKAMALEQQSAQQGDKNGQYLLGIMHDNGLNVGADPAQA